MKEGGVWWTMPWSMPAASCSFVKQFWIAGTPCDLHCSTWRSMRLLTYVCTVNGPTLLVELKMYLSSGRSMPIILRVSAWCVCVCINTKRAKHTSAA